MPYAKKLMLRVLTSFRRNVHLLTPVIQSEVGLSEGQSRAVEASYHSPPAPLPLLSSRAERERPKDGHAKSRDPIPVDIQQRPVRESSEIAARRPIFRVLCGSTNPILQSISRAYRECERAQRHRALLLPPVMLSEVGLSEGQSHAVEASLPAPPASWGTNFYFPSASPLAPLTHIPATFTPRDILKPLLADGLGRRKLDRRIDWE